MALRIIGAGFGRTGTDSLRAALDILGFGPCYHMHVVLPDPRRYDMWTRILNNQETPDWDAIFDGFGAGVDWPVAHYWRELSQHYPEAKIILSQRSSESWHRSIDGTILARMRVDSGIAPSLAKVVFDGRIDDRDHVIATYERNIAEVKATFGPDRLLVLDLGSGWEPLCAFLGVAVPDTPYPRGNEPDAFHQSADEFRDQRDS